MNILIVEDEPILAMLAAEVLQDVGHTVVGPAHDVAAALAHAESQTIQLAFVDINLAGENEGIKLAQDLLRLHGVPSVFVSGQYDTARAARGSALGLLKKPYDPEELLETALVAKRLIAGGTPPPPAVPAALEIF